MSLLTFFVNNESTFCQQQNSRFNTPQFEGQVLGDFKDTDSIRVFLIQEFTFYNQDYDDIEFYVRLDSTGSFRFVLPRTKNMVQMSLVYYSENNRHEDIGTYVVEPEDHIKISVSRQNKENTVAFSGSNSSKYNCSYRCKVERDNWRKYRLGFVKSNREMLLSIDSINQYRSIYQIGISKSLEILNGYKTDITPKAFDLIRSSCIGYFENIFALTLRERYSRYLGKSDSARMKKVINAFNHFMSEADTTNSQYSSLSMEYVEYLMNKTKVWLYFSENGTPYTLSQQFEALHTRFTGILKEKLLVLTLTSNFGKRDVKDYDNDSSKGKYLERILATIKTPYLVGAVKKTFHSLKGTQAFNFAFPDTSGKIVRLTDFKGKAVLIDMWYTGCGGCIKFARLLKDSILTEFVHNNQFVIISINLDEDKRKWLHSLKSDKYSSKSKYVNLNTAGLGNDNPLSEYYNINVFPHIILIDKQGRLLKKMIPQLSPASLIRLINEAVSS